MSELGGTQLSLTAVLCDGSKRQTRAFLWKVSHPASPPRDAPLFFTSQLFLVKDNHSMVVARSFRCPGVAAVTFFSWKPQGLQRKEITLSGGSLGSCVDEERSQLRELM